MTYVSPLDGPSAEPIGPGSVLDDLLKKIGVSQENFADAIQTSRFTVNQIVNGKRKVTTAMALKIAKSTNTSAAFWLNLQRNVDAYEARLRIADELAAVRVVREATPPELLVIDLD
ncbi:HigA family addiction module antitoxin [Rhizobium sp. BK176]|uniref:HigA family addiction module antitoxin n=1 Tax=Rhizobium sp. BK176 TaxID=2587071 RepID=UPI002166E412|nr:HigA family addiction module antitoxin [Rhizobium sp. BK176]MCS4088795.1 addiction module HigA family antidote [Rhizobium sp. BK176]